MARRIEGIEKSIKRTDMNLIQIIIDLFKNYKNDNFAQEYEQLLEMELKEIKEENHHLSNYAVHKEFCTWRFNGNGVCDCGLIKNQIEK